MSFELIVDEAEELFETKQREYKGGPRGPKPRAEEQKPWDEAFKTAMDADKPLVVQIAPDAADEARKRVASSARFFERAVTEGVPKPGKAPNTVILAWKIRVPQKRGPRKPSQTSAE